MSLLSACHAGERTVHPDVVPIAFAHRRPSEFAGAPNVVATGAFHARAA